MDDFDFDFEEALETAKNYSTYDVERFKVDYRKMKGGKRFREIQVLGLSLDNFL